MRKAALLAVVVAAALAAVLAVVLTGPRPQAGQASSHREAPLISEDPAADNTDTYVFRSPDAPETVTILANWLPGEPLRQPTRRTR